MIFSLETPSSFELKMHQFFSQILLVKNKVQIIWGLRFKLFDELCFISVFSKVVQTHIDFYKFINNIVRTYTRCEIEY